MQNNYRRFIHNIVPLEASWVSLLRGGTTMNEVVMNADY